MRWMANVAVALYDRSASKGFLQLGECLLHCGSMLESPRADHTLLLVTAVCAPLGLLARGVQAFQHVSFAPRLGSRCPSLPVCVMCSKTAITSPLRRP